MDLTKIVVKNNRASKSAFNTNIKKKHSRTQSHEQAEALALRPW